MATIKASPFKLALVQLGQVGKDKTRNLAHAREMVLKAAEGAEGQGKVDVVVLPVSRTGTCCSKEGGRDLLPLPLVREPEPQHRRLLSRSRPAGRELRFGVPSSGPANAVLGKRRIGCHSCLAQCQTQ